MSRIALCLLINVVVCGTTSAQSPSYYDAIQKNSSNRLKPDQFKRMEEDALKEYSRPEVYESLATSFGNTTEKVWAVIYGEVFCNLSADSERTRHMGDLVFGWYDASLSVEGKGISADLTEHAEGSQEETPFESRFELSFLMAAAPYGSRVKPLSIEELSSIRKNQLSSWSERRLPSNELVQRQQALIAGGYFEAYNFWLFQAARPDEFNQWLGTHQTQLQGWLDWQKSNAFAVTSPDIQRIYYSRDGK